MKIVIIMMLTACSLLVAADFHGTWDTPSQGRTTTSLKNTRYTFDVTNGNEEVIIELVGVGVDGYLYVIDNFGNTVINSRSGAASEQLHPGSYTIIPTTYNSGITGNYTLSINGPVANVQAISSPHQTITDTITLSGGRSYKSPKNAFYSFTLDDTDRIEIQLEGPEIKVRIFILDSYDNLVFEHRLGSSNAGYYSDILDAGQYKIVVGTYYENQTGIYTMDIWGSVSNLEKITIPHLHLNGSITLSGGHDPTSPNNPRYNFDVDSTGYVLIEYQGSGFVEWLSLLDSYGNVIYQPRGGGPGSGKYFDILEPGTYTVVAGTYYSETTGGFTIDIWGNVSNLR